MKNLGITIYLLIALSNHAKAQYGNVWAFGWHYGLDFNSGTPVFFDTTAINTAEGSASFCDSLGNLLYYTDGFTMWNKNHQQMPNGDSLETINGGSYAVQVGAFMPIENTNFVYVVITEPYVTDTINFKTKLRVHKIDRTANNGLGDVVEKNKVLMRNPSEKLATTRHCNGQDWWIVTHDMYTDEYLSFLLHAFDGSITGPVISHTGLNLFESDNAQGQIKISPNGKYLSSTYLERYFEIAKFDNATGIILPVLQVPSYGWNPQYSCAFSYDSKFVYVGNQAIDSVTYLDSIPDNDIIDVRNSRYSLENPDSLAILQSKTMLQNRDSMVFFGGMQLAPDGNIYVRGAIRDTTINPSWVRSKLFVITQNSDSTVETNILFPQYNINSSIGLPSFPDAIFTNRHIANLRIPTCIAGNYTTIAFYDSLLTTTRNYIWHFNDPASGANDSANAQYPIHQFSAPGTYNVTLTLPSQCNPISITKQVVVPNTAPPTPTIQLIGNQLTSSTANQYQWYFNNTLITGANSQSYTPANNGNYTVQVTNALNCTASSQPIQLFNVGSNSIASTNQISMYPNPAKGMLTVVVENNQNNQLTILIRDLTGRNVIDVVNEKVKGLYKKDINISTLAQGTYFVYITHNGIETVNKLTVKE
jgi:hypothetical protein